MGKLFKIVKASLWLLLLCSGLAVQSASADSPAAASRSQSSGKKPQFRNPLKPCRTTTSGASADAASCRSARTGRPSDPANSHVLLDTTGSGRP